MLNIENLSRREQEVIYVCHRVGRVSAEILQEELADGTSYSGARRFLSKLEEKGFLSVEKEGARNYYKPVADTTEVGIGLLKKAFSACFRGSSVMGIANFVQQEGSNLDQRELAYLEKLSQDAKEAGR